MHKLAYTLTHCPDALWVQALRQKYKLQGLCPLSIARNCCSPFWRALSNVWDSVRDNVSWIVGNGMDVNVWNDTWVPSLGPLRLWLRSSPLVVASLTFDDLLLHDRQWDVNRLSGSLLPEAIPFVVGIPPPLVGTCDVLSWNSTPAGNFTVASAYARLLESVWEAIDPKWS
ncbi:hypothetical protein V6N11_037646 [Hibiscus sabdariffa]|uniref:Uncharacterized protein n=2 Tax=Hibiscus sabdariffa TaxID=183260 RepID=A0ABR2PBW1_9ROSI